MKLYHNGSPADPALLNSEAEGFVCFAEPKERHGAMQALGLPPQIAGESTQHRSSYLESLNGFDYISMNIPQLNNIMQAPILAEIIFTGRCVLFVSCGLPATHALEQDIQKWKGTAPAPERVLLQFFARLTGGDAALLEKMEEDIALLEDRVMSRKSGDITPKISKMRKKLLVLKRYYEALMDLLEDLEENENKLFSQAQLRYFRLQTNRADRLFHDVLNLRDYVTQVRESYQNQLDISLNQTMKLFTVVTTIFLPLTLITSWYGMNLKMPEFAQPFAYPVVIFSCILVVIGCILYFKKHRWF